MCNVCSFYLYSAVCPVMIYMFLLFFNSKNLPLILYHIVACNEFSTVYRGINDISDSDSVSDSDKSNHRVVQQGRN